MATNFSFAYANIHLWGFTLLTEGSACKALLKVDCNVEHNVKTLSDDVSLSSSLDGHRQTGHRQDRGWGDAAVMRVC